MSDLHDKIVAALFDTVTGLDYRTEIDVREAGEVATKIEALIADLLAVRPCHITGEHTPDHNLTSEAICAFQRKYALDGLLAALGIEATDLPRKIHDGCYWCSDGQHAQQHREWAGASA